jgi:hypothetical protein
MQAPLVATRQLLGIWPTMSFWWHRRHLQLAFPLALPLIVPGLLAAQLATLLISVLFDLQGTTGLWLASFIGAAGSLLANLAALGVLERWIRFRARQVRESTPAIES